MKILNKYVRMFREFFRACLVEEFEYRANFLANVLTALFGLALSLLTVQLFFYRADDIGGWGYYEVLALLGIFNAMQGAIQFFLQPNMSKLVSHIRMGTLDFILIKPVDSQFFVSLRHLVFWRLADVAIGLGLVGFSLMQMGVILEFKDILMFVIVFTAGLMIVYSFWMGMMIFSFWAVKVDNLSYLFSSFFETARFPVSVYKGLFRFALMYIFPVALITTFPAASIVGRLGWSEALISLGVALFFMWLSRRLWRFALRNYTSASS
jgi:ABC-2 type transport system permease protein